MNKVILTLLGFIAAVNFSCSLKKKNQFLSYEEQLKLDINIIENYLAQNNLTAKTTPEGLRYKITKTGNGIFPKIGSTVFVNYTGKLLNGDIFDSNTKDDFSFHLGKKEVISGWDIGISLLSKGGKATLYLPSGLAYGTRGAGGSIGSNEVLIFDVELVDIK